LSKTLYEKAGVPPTDGAGAGAAPGAGATAGGPAGASGGDDDTIDAEFEVK
jgi:hypothetical protein